MSKSSVIKSSIMNKTWMALTGLFLCTFLVGHLLGNLQLILHTGEEGKRAFNEYAYFMGHNIFIKILAYVTYFAILFHAFKGLWLWRKNKQARPQKYAYERPETNTKLPSRYMALLGTIILVFICTHMANFWWKQKVTGDVPLQTITKTITTEDAQGQPINSEIIYYLTTNGTYLPENHPNQDVITSVNSVEKTLLYDADGVNIGEGYKDLHTVVMEFFGKQNSWSLLAVIFYVISMFTMAFHLWHGFASAHQSLGLNHRKYNAIIALTGKAFAVFISAAFAIIPIIIYLRS